MTPDPMGDADGFYVVRSLYFDSIDWRCFHEKEAGNAERHKLRVRGYIDSTGSFSSTKCEVKHRRNQRIGKVVARIDSDYERLRPCLQQSHLPSADLLSASPELCWFMNLKTASQLVPVVNIQFRRQAFVSAGNADLRVTIDDRLAAHPARDLHERWNAIPHPAWQAILEIKVSRNLPLWVQRLAEKYHLRRQPISKYCQAVARCPFGLS
jgi:hypothetical protein